MAVLRPTYPTKTNDPSDPDNIRKFQADDANQLKAVAENHADNIETILAALGLNEGTNSIGSFVSLTVLNAAYPDGANGSYAIIDDGLGGTPAIALYNNVSGEWELADPDESIIWVADQGSLPVTGTAQKLYIALDSGNFYYWSGGEYQTAGPTVSVVVKYIQNNGTYYRTEKGYGNSGSAHEQDDVIESWYDSNRDRWIRAVVLQGPLVLPGDFDDKDKIFLLIDKLKV